jgi:hypothetical protein
MVRELEWQARIHVHRRACCFVRAANGSALARMSVVGEYPRRGGGSFVSIPVLFGGAARRKKADERSRAGPLDCS